LVGVFGKLIVVVVVRNRLFVVFNGCFVVVVIGFSGSRRFLVLVTDFKVALRIEVLEESDFVVAVISERFLK
jgi:hypothetical protein